MSDLNSRQAGESGLDLPAGGNLDDWQAGKSIRDWNNAELERQRDADPEQRLSREQKHAARLGQPLLRREAEQA